MHVKTVTVGKNIYLEHFCVVQEDKFFFAIYERDTDGFEDIDKENSYDRSNLISKGKTQSEALKKAKFLQHGYSIAKSRYLFDWS